MRPAFQEKTQANNFLKCIFWDYNCFIDFTIAQLLSKLANCCRNRKQNSKAIQHLLGQHCYKKKKNFLVSSFKQKFQVLTNRRPCQRTIIKTDDADLLVISISLFSKIDQKNY